MDGDTLHVNSTVASFSNGTNAPDEYRFIQPFWDLILRHHDIVRSSLFPVILSTTVYFTSVVFLFAIDMLCYNQAWYKKYKIQPDKEVKKEQILDAIINTFWNEMLFVVPASIGQLVWVPPADLPALAPTVYDFVFQQVIGLILFDFQYYIYHVVHHKVPFLYKHIHSVHHRFASPFGFATQHMHPWELVLVGFLTTTNMWYFNAHPLTTWSFMLANIFMAVESHCGFDMPFGSHHWDPTGMVGGAPKHDMHHLRPNTNFQPFFSYLDKLFGTYCPNLTAGGKKGKELQEYERRAHEGRKCH